MIITLECSLFTSCTIKYDAIGIVYDSVENGNGEFLIKQEVHTDLNVYSMTCNVAVWSVVAAQ